MKYLLILLVLGGCAVQASNTCVAKCAECKGAEFLCDFNRSGAPPPVVVPLPK